MEKLIYTDDELVSAFNDITLKNSIFNFKWKFEFEKVPLIGGQYWHVWVSFERPDTNTGEVGDGKGRIELIKCGSSYSYVIKTCWLLLKLLVLHELMESFKVDGCRVFNPHHTIEELSQLEKQRDIL